MQKPHQVRIGEAFVYFVTFLLLMFLPQYMPFSQYFLNTMNRLKILYLASILMLSIVSCTSPIQPAFDEKLLLKTWYFDFTKTALFSDSNKESYLADGQPLPPARGRTGMTFGANGKYTYIGIAPADGPLLFDGSWAWTGEKTILVKREAKAYQGASWAAEETKYEILSLSATELVLRRLP